MAGRVQKDVSSGFRFVAVTPHDSTPLPAGVRGLYVGTGGNVALNGVDGAAATFANVVGGTVLPVQVSLVKSTGTTASNIVAMY